ncbi:M48 family metallopeptidase [soil metagenome]
MPSLSFPRRSDSPNDHPRRFLSGRVIIALVIAGFSIFSYLAKSQINPVTGEKQHISISANDEIALGLEAAPQMAAEFGGESTDAAAAARVSQIGGQVVAASDAAKSDYQFQFHLLADDKTVNAFALPGGQIFITEALYRRLESDGQLAGVLGHEVGHVVGRHAAEHMAKQQLTSGLTGAAVIATSADNHSQRDAAIAMMVANLVSLKYGRSDELEADRLGVHYMSQTSYDPHSMMRVMEILKQATGGSRQPEFLSTHPDPGNRIEKIQTEIDKEFPGGVAAGMKK